MKFTVSLAVICLVFAFCNAATENIYGDITNYKVIGRIFMCTDIHNRMHYNVSFPQTVIIAKNMRIRKSKLKCLFFSIFRRNQQGTWSMELNMKIPTSKRH